jgi:hypothetical protein
MSLNQPFRNDRFGIMQAYEQKKAVLSMPIRKSIIHSLDDGRYLPSLCSAGGCTEPLIYGDFGRERR